MTSIPRILLVEDNEQNAYLVRYLLERAGMQVTVTRSGRDGLRLAQANLPDVILLDIQLPDLDGYEVAAMMRAEPALQAVPIIAVSSFAMPAERQKAFSIGCNGYIEKPILPLKFVEQIRAFLSRP